MTATGRSEARTLVAGWFSFSGTGTTVGDVMAKDVVCSWLEAAGMRYDVAIAPAFGSGVDWRRVDQSHYSHVIFVCGPFYRSDLLRRFEGSKLVGVDLSMIEPVRDWNPFDLLLERDSEELVRPDLAFGAPRMTVPVVGFAPLPPEDADAGREQASAANELLQGLLESRRVSVAPIDTRLEGRADGLSASPASVESLIGRLDAVVTARLHGLVLALRNGVPALALDPTEGGGKIVRQASALGWPAVLRLGEATDDRLNEAFEFCLSDEARALARERATDGARRVEEIGRTFVERMSQPVSDDGWGDGRRRGGWVTTSGSRPVARIDRVRTLVRREAKRGVRSVDRWLRTLERRL